MTRPHRYLAWMFAGVAAAAILVLLLYRPLWIAFQYNALLNGFITTVLAIGICFILWQVFRLYREINWIEGFRRGDQMLSDESMPTLLAPMAAILGERRGGRLNLSALSLRSLLDGVNARLDESHDIARYLIGLMVFLGLLGTFWGLLGTITSVGDAVSSLSVTSGDAAALFSELKSGLQAPLSGMGTAFSSSMFGLAGSLLLGFLELQASQAHNRFFNELEDWLSGQTKLASSASVVDGDQPVPAYIQALLEQTAESLENLQRTMARGEEGRIQANSSLKALTDRLGMLSDQMRAEQQIMVRLSENQAELRPVLGRMLELMSEGGFGIDESSRTHIRNLDAHMNRMLEEMSIGRQYMVQELRSEIKLLARTIAAIAEESER